MLVGEEHLHGVIGAKPVHLLSADEKKKLPKWDELVLDMGILPEAERRTAAREGTYVYFAQTLPAWEKAVFAARQLMTVQVVLCCCTCWSRKPPTILPLLFWCRKKSDCGAKAAAYTVNPEFALVLEATTAADIAGAEGDAKSVQSGRRSGNILYGSRCNL